MRSAAAVLCLAAVVVTGCGAAPTDSSQDFDGDKRAVAVVIEDLETTARKADPGRVCDALLSASLRDALKKQGTNCATAVREAIQDTDSFALTVDEVTVTGTKATAKVTSGEGSKQKTDTLELDREGAAWRIAALGG